MPQHIDQAIDIIKGTNDGDALSSDDLCLVEVVVNHGLSSLTPDGQKYWQGLHERVVSNTYARPWLHGQEHLTKDSAGNVFWKAQKVENYTFTDRDEEARAAKELALVCQTVEARSMPVTWTSCSRIYDEVRFGQGIESARWHVLWAFDAGRAAFAAVPETSMDLDEAKLRAKQVKASTAAAWGLSDSDFNLRHQMVCSSNDHADCLKAIRGDMAWAQTVLRSRVVEEIEMAFLNQLDPATLTSKAEFSRRILARPTEHEETLGANDGHTQVATS